MVTLLVEKKNWNENLPLQIQNWWVQFQKTHFEETSINL